MQKSAWQGWNVGLGPFPDLTQLGSSAWERERPGGVGGEGAVGKGRGCPVPPVAGGRVRAAPCACSVQEFMTFTSQLIVERSQLGSRASVKEQGERVAALRGATPPLAPPSLGERREVWGQGGPAGPSLGLAALPAGPARPPVAGNLPVPSAGGGSGGRGQALGAGGGGSRAAPPLPDAASLPRVPVPRVRAERRAGRRGDRR